MLSRGKFLKKRPNLHYTLQLDGGLYTFWGTTGEFKANHTGQDGKLVWLYASNKEEQHSYLLRAAKQKFLRVLLLDSPIVTALKYKIRNF